MLPYDMVINAHLSDMISLGSHYHFIDEIVAVIRMSILQDGDALVQIVARLANSCVKLTFIYL